MPCLRNMSGESQKSFNKKLTNQGIKDSSRTITKQNKQTKINDPCCANT